MNPLQKQNSKGAWLLSAFLAIAVVVLAVLYFKTLTTDPCDSVKANLTITFPCGSTDVVKQEDDFVKALNAHSKPIDPTQKSHVLYWDGTLIPGGVVGQSPTLPNVGSHVTQWVSFSCLGQLEQFAAETKSTPNCTP
jgi:hypothetical protein